MTLLEAIILGVVQGATEFLPVSSSGHLVLARNFFAITEPSLLFDVLLHFATVLAVIVFFWKDLVSLKFPDLFKVFIASIPAGLLGILFEDRIENAFGSTLFVGFALLITASLVLIADRKIEMNKKLASDEESSSGSDMNSRTVTKTLPSTPLSGITMRQAVITGLFQALALLPGVSRSGSTVSGGIMSGISRENAFRFSFIMVIPVILGATVLQVFEAWENGFIGVYPQEFVFGGIAAFIVGLLSLALFRYVIRQSRLSWFGAYAGILGMLTIIMTLLS